MDEKLRVRDIRLEAAEKLRALNETDQLNVETSDEVIPDPAETPQEEVVEKRTWNAGRANRNLELMFFGGSGNPLDRRTLQFGPCGDVIARRPRT